MSFPRYAEYKDSGVEWLGEVPQGWTITPIKHIGFLKAGAGFPHEEQGISGEEIPFHKVNALALVDESGYLIPKENSISRLTALKLGAYIFPPHTIVFAKIGAALLLGRIRLLKEFSCIDNNMMGLIINHDDYLISFIRYAMALVKFDLIANLGTVPSLNEFQIGNFAIAIPSKQEQTQIAAFLDHETAKLDNLINQQKKLIDLLKEKRQAVISHAVTKGLNPNAPMKDSGVEWLGKVPEGWVVTKVKYIAELTPKKSEVYEKQNLMCSFIPMEKLKLDTLILDEEKPIHEVFNGYTYFRNDDLLIAKVTPCFENKNMVIASGLTNGIGFGSSEIYVLRTTNKINTEFLYYRLQENKFTELAVGSMSGAGGLKRVPSDFLNHFEFALPPQDEQLKILTFIKECLLKNSALMQKAESAIQLLQERRTALISAAVTGKIDVRHWKPN